jgi:hypothetical protein
MIDRLIVNANIHTLDEIIPRASSLAIVRDRIVAVGGDELRMLADKTTQIDNLHGATILPGLVDAHIHWEWTARSLREVTLFGLSSKAATLARVAEAVAKSKPAGWLTGRGWSNSEWADGAFPTATDLDAVTGDIPTLLRARSGHGVWLNTAALRKIGITDSTPDPAGGVIVRDAAGKATGILLEEAIGLLDGHVPDPTPAELAAMMEEAQQLAWRSGLTGIHDFDPPTAFEAMQLLHQQGRLGLRVVKQINDPWIHHAHGLKVRFGFGNDWLRIGALKLFADGALGTRTAAMIEPYDGEPHNVGVVVKDKEVLYEFISEASRQGLPSTVHAIGDKAVHDVLDAFALVRAEEQLRGLHPTERRHRIEHVQIIHPDDVHRLAVMDIIASMQPIHATSDYEVADRYWGARSQWAYNPRLQLDAGARVAFGSDSPIEPFDPIKNIYAAVARRREDGSPGPDGWYPGARITIDEAVRGFTQGPAYAGGMEDRLGRVARGYLADLVVLDLDPYGVPPDHLLRLEVVGTMVGGVWQYHRLK